MNPPPPVSTAPTPLPPPTPVPVTRLVPCPVPDPREDPNDGSDGADTAERGPVSRELRRDRSRLSIGDACSRSRAGDQGLDIM